MPSYSWKTDIDGDWSTATDWSLNLAPNDPTADVTIDAPALLGSYTVTIAAGKFETINSLTLNGVNNLVGSYTRPYKEAKLEVDGTLTFTPGSSGLLGGSLQSFVGMNNGTIVNVGTINGFIQGLGNVLFTGTNGFYVTNWLQSLGGTVTVDTKSIAEMSGNTLFDGIYEAQGSGAIVNLGGPLQNLIVNIATIEGPPLIPDGWTELFLNSPDAQIREWNGAGYVPLEATVTTIDSRGTLDVLKGRNYTTANSLTINTGGMLDLQAGTVTTAGIDINGGVVQGSATIAGNVINNGSLLAVGGTLDILGNLTGSGVARFDYDQRELTHVAIGATLEVHGVSAGQTIIMNGVNTLQLDTPAAFAGKVSATVGDKIVLQGVSVTSAAVSGSTLVLSDGVQTAGSLGLSGSYVGEGFSPTVIGGNTTLTVTVPPVPNINPPPQGSFAVSDTTTNVRSTAAGAAYSGPIPGPQHEYINITPDSLNITSAIPNAFIHTGSGNDVIDVSKVNGANVLDGSDGSNLLIGGTGDDTFFVGAPLTTGPSWTTIANFHAGDGAAFWGLSQADFAFTWQDNQGTAGYTGLTLQAAAPGKPVASITLAGYSTADLSNGRLSVSFGTDPGNGVNYLAVHGH